MRKGDQLGAAIRTGVVLSSGGARGVYAHTGFLMALERLGIEITAMAGCSAGAVVGGVYASGAALSQWADAIATAQPRDYWEPDSWFKFIWNIAVRKGRGYTGLSGTDNSIEFIRRNLGAKTFDACFIPFYSLAINLSQGTKTLFGEGELAPRIMASAAVPVFYRPVNIDGELYSDGAVIEMSPSEAICCKHKLDVLIIHHTSTHHYGPAGMDDAMQQPWTLVTILERLLQRDRPWYLSDEPVAVRHCRCGCGAPIIVLEPDLPELAWPTRAGGPKVQAAAMKQALELLATQMDIIKPGV